MALNPIPERNYKELIGVPYEESDCWGIIVRFYKIMFNIELNEYYKDRPQNDESARDTIYACMKDFVEVPSPEYGDLILIKVRGVASHIAVYVGGGFMLHTAIHCGCIVERIARWEKTVVGYYRAKI